MSGLALGSFYLLPLGSLMVGPAYPVHLSHLLGEPSQLPGPSSPPRQTPRHRDHEDSTFCLAGDGHCGCSLWLQNKLPQRQQHTGDSELCGWGLGNVIMCSQGCRHLKARLGPACEIAQPGSLMARQQAPGPHCHVGLSLSSSQCGSCVSQSEDSEPETREQARQRSCLVTSS